MQGPPLWWASKHRRHHAHCDTEQDPHSPVVFGKLYAWLGWAYLSDVDAEGPFGNRGHDLAYMQDHLRFPELALMENLYWVPIAFAHGCFYAYGGVGWCVFVSMMSGVLCQMLTMYFNVAFHTRSDSHEHTVQHVNMAMNEPRGSYRVRSVDNKRGGAGIEPASNADVDNNEKVKAGGGGGGGVCRAVDLPYDPLSNIFGEAHHAW